MEEPESETNDNENESESSDSDIEDSEMLSEEELNKHETRIDRALCQTMRLVNQKKRCGVFTIRSSLKGCLYLVRIKSIPSCTCMDYAEVNHFQVFYLLIMLIIIYLLNDLKGNSCKHIKSVLMKGYGLDPDSPLLRQQVLSERNLSKMNIDVLNCEMEMCEEKVACLLKAHDDRSIKKMPGKKLFPCHTPTSMSADQSGTDT